MERDLSQNIEIWINDLEKMDFTQIAAQPSPNSWSLGQVFMHLIEATDFYMEQIRICLSTNNQENEEMTSAVKEIFHNNDFPDDIIEGPASNANTPQPESKEALISRLLKLKAEALKYQTLISSIQSTGKTKHPGLNYLNALEWYHFAEMHFRHHFRRNKRIKFFHEVKSAH